MVTHEHTKAKVFIGVVVGIFAFGTIVSALLYGSLTQLWVNILQAMGL